MASRTDTPAAPARLSPERVDELRERLCRWFAAARRELPWRRTREPYAVLVSEAMLQQTRVETVTPYYERFMERFPDAGALASADEDEVLALWSGLGYYRRARALRAAALAIVNEHGGAFPETRAALLALPGIGPYTAGAVLSIAFAQAEPLVDGNVARVFSRLFGLEEPLGSSALTRELWELARRLVPPADAPAGATPREWNQAVMELGALVCTPRSPLCGECPLAAGCHARHTGRTEELPRPAPRKATVDVRLEVLLAERGARTLFFRRPAGGRMAGMWELPTRELPANGSVTTRGLWPDTLACGAPDLVLGEELDEVRHGITQHRIRASVRQAAARGRGAGSDPAWRWLAPGEEELPLTGMTRKILKRRRARSGTRP